MPSRNGSNREYNSSTVERIFIMKKILISIFFLTLIFLSYSFSDEQTDKEEIRKTLKFSGNGETRRILVDNINGSIKVVGYDGSDVELVAHKTIRAESSDKVLEAKEKVTLEITEESDRVLVYVDAPWRQKDGCVHNRGWDYYGYDVDYDFEFRVPSKTDVILKTINNGDIFVKNIQGHFEVNNINGAIEMQDIAGSGTVSTINGGVTVSFTQNPSASSSFKTINGKVDVQFQKNLSANLTLKTMNGEVYTDFPVKDLPPSTPLLEKHGHKNILRSSDSFTVQVAGGGPELSFNTLNGNIYILTNEGESK